MTHCHLQLNLNIWLNAAIKGTQGKAMEKQILTRQQAYLSPLLSNSVIHLSQKKQEVHHSIMPKL